MNKGKSSKVQELNTPLIKVKPCFAPFGVGSILAIRDGANRGGYVEQGDRTTTVGKEDGNGREPYNSNRR